MLAAKGEAVEAAEAVKLQTSAALSAERGRVVTDLRKEVGDLALELAEKVLGEALTNDAKARAVIDRFISDLESAGGKK